jgi:hypothetical protein
MKGKQMTNTKKVAEVGGWVGMVLIHGATLPVTIAVILGMSTHLPPLSMVIMIWFGLALFFSTALHLGYVFFPQVVIPRPLDIQV